MTYTAHLSTAETRRLALVSVASALHPQAYARLSSDQRIALANYAESRILSTKQTLIDTMIYGHATTDISP